MAVVRYQGSENRNAARLVRLARRVWRLTLVGLLR